MTAITRPLLRYHGGKFRLAPWILEQFPDHRRYVESFGGGASVLLLKSRAFAEVYNDLDGEVVNVFRVARDQGEELTHALQLTPFAREEFDGAYEVSTIPLERARRCIIRSFMGFGADGIVLTHSTGFRGNTTRRGSTPAGDWANFPSALPAIIERLQGVVIEQRDAFEVIERYDGPDTLHYVDPPYVHGTRSRVDAQRGYAHELTDNDHRRLAQLLGKVKGTVILSGYHSELYDELYGRESGPDWKVREKTGALADQAGQRTEVLWMRNIPRGLFSDMS